MICPKFKDKMCPILGGCSMHDKKHEHLPSCDDGNSTCPKCIPCQEEVKMERCKHQGKTYEKLRSLAPRELKNDQPCSDEFFEYTALFGCGDPKLETVLTNARINNWLPWLISHGFIGEVKNAREEHFEAFHRHIVKSIYAGVSREGSRAFWAYFDPQNPNGRPIPKE